jgi:hypothetical protein
MHTAGTAGHRARWRPRLGAVLEAGAAVRTLVARLVTAAGGGVVDPPSRPSEPRSGDGPHSPAGR